MRNLDQAAKLREIVKLGKRPVHRSENAVPMVAVTGGKGGTGKTLTAVNLAVALRETGRKVLLVDLDPGLANADILLGVHPRVTMEECLSERRPLTDSIMMGPGGILFLPGASGSPALAEDGAFTRAGLWSTLQNLRPRVDVIVLDTGAGLSPAVIAPLQRADMALLITTPEPAAVTDAYALLKVWRQKRGNVPAGLMINRVANREEAVLTATRLRQVSRRFLGTRPDLYGWLSESKVVAESSRQRKPFMVDNSFDQAANEIRSLAANVIGGLEGASASQVDNLIS